MKDSDLLKIDSIELDMKAVFTHQINLIDKSGFIIESMTCSPDKSDDIFKQIHKVWYEAKIKGEPNK